MDINEIIDRLNRYADKYAEEHKQVPSWETGQRQARMIIELTLRHIVNALREGDPPPWDAK